MALLAETLSGGGKLAAIVQALPGEGGDGIAAAFAKELFSGVDAAEFDPYGARDLANVAAAAFEIFRKRRAGETKIAVGGLFAGKTEFLAIDIVNDDMPFLLDSVLGALRDLGLAPELVAHPIFETRRDKDGALTALSAAGAVPDGGLRESFIHVHIRKLGPLPPSAEIEAALARTLADVRLAVADFPIIERRLAAAIEHWGRNPPPAAAETNAESIAFLRWLAADNFIFLGVREYGYAGGRDEGQLVPRPELSLGLLRDETVGVLRQNQDDHRLRPQGRAFFLNSPPVIILKAIGKSTVHRRAHMDAVAVKLYGADGAIAGVVLFVGLFAATAYNLPTRAIPLLRRKADKVMLSSGHAPESHSGRALTNILDTFPRDELFQIAPAQLSRICGEVLKIDLTPRPRAFVRRDEFGRYVTVFIYVPRERHNTEVRHGIERMLEQAFGGRLDAATPFFPESAMVRVHYVLWREEAELKNPAEADLESQVEAIIRTWCDAFRDLILDRYGGAGYDLIRKYLDAFPAGYQETNAPERALEDMARFERLGTDRPTDIDLTCGDAAGAGNVRATLQQLDEPLTLSKRVPILENFGFDVISERTFRLTPQMDGEARRVFLHDSDLRLPGACADLAAVRANLEEGFLAVWSGAAPDDRFNGLILSAGLDWRQAAVLRAYGSYYRQTGAPYSLAYVAETLNKYAAAAADLFALFDAQFNPANGLGADGREAERSRIAKRVGAALDRIPLIDDDRILRDLLALIGATLRTNFYQRGEGGKPPDAIAFKLRSREIEWLPAPKPYAEIFVQAPHFEGVHLRGGPVARGGLRWSDRPQDFRTEILGLAKAQQAKNAVIVPQGAKGGFAPRKLAADREAVQAEGLACYEAFVSSLLSITDTLVKGAVVPPADTIRRDGDDPYLVVAADKGTAAFSDIANGIALRRGFWLGDAFASGGSAGYDHKKMGITAKGAWEAVKRHFREMNIDVQTAPFTVAGVGDMSGDVFGNGMLQSKAIKLVAAFDHRDIFIDPDPDPASSFKERKRLFELPRSSWQDYERSKLSAGGGVFSRGAKHIALSPQARKLLDLGESAAPNEVIAAILKAPADLLWFGGIGAYIRASAETDAQVGDKANDAIRIAAKEARARVIGEGANLAVTQKGRIEFAAHGGRINSDAIDNSAGVNTSDVEVNIKIALGDAMAEGALDEASRNALLHAMTADVAGAVLKNNYLQTLAISIAESEGLSDLGFQQRLMQKLEKEGRLDRALEALPSDAEILDRQAAGLSLTRPEIAALLAYAKIALKDDLIHSAAPDDPYFRGRLFDYFPKAMRERFAAGIEAHRLRREIIATSLANDIIDSGGPTIVVRMSEETGATAQDIAHAFAAAMAIYDVDALYTAIDALDGKIDGRTQLALYRRVQTLLRRQTAWFLRRQGRFAQGLEPEIARYREGADAILSGMAALLPQSARARLQEDEARFEADGAPPELARRLAALGPLSHALDIVSVARAAGAPVAAAAKIVFAIRDAFRLDELAQASEALAAGDHFNRLAVDASLAAIASAQRALATSILPAFSDFAAWRRANESEAARVAESLAEMLTTRAPSLAKLTVGVSQLRDLASG